MSTVEISVIPPFLAAVLILASASKNSTPKYPVAFEVPTLLPTALLVAVTGSVREQLDSNATITNVAQIVVIFLNITKDLVPYS